MSIDKERRRLTVGSEITQQVKELSGKGSAEELPECIRDKSKYKKVVLVGGVTDADKQRRRSFTEKDHSADGTLGSKEESEKYIKSKGIAYRCKKGLKPESPNQDTFSILYVEDIFAVYCVFDGHGPNGHDVSNEARRLVLKLFLTALITDKKKPEDALDHAFVETQIQLEGNKDLDASVSGATGTMAYHDLEAKKMWIAHVGDSRAVMVTKKGSGVAAADLTVDHKPNLPEEKKRIESANPPGRVVFDGFYNHRVFAQNGNYPGLNMSRAFGDIVAHKEAGLTAKPDIKQIDLAKEHQSDQRVLTIASDGVWEFIESDAGAQLVMKHEKNGIVDVETAAEKLTKEAWDLWMKDSDNELSDDISAVLVTL